MNPWLSRRVIGWAHQGGASEGPPNTIEAMQKAVDNGAVALEFDLRRTYDCRLVLHHDAHLAVPGKRRRISSLSFDELRQAKPDLATLEEALTTFKREPMTIEIKARDAVKATASRLAPEVGHRDLIVTAFSPFIVRAFKRAAPQVDTAPGWTSILLFWLATRLPGCPAPRLKGHVALQVAHRLDELPYLRRIPFVRNIAVADRLFVEAAHDREIAVHSWTLDEETEIQESLDAAIDGIMSDSPSVLMAILTARGVSWTGGPEDHAD